MQAVFSFYRFDKNLDDPVLILNGHAGAVRQTNAIGKQFVRNAPTFLMRIITYPLKHRLQMKRFPYRSCFDIFFRKCVDNVHWRYTKHLTINRQRRQPTVGHRAF